VTVRQVTTCRTVTRVEEEPSEEGDQAVRVGDVVPPEALHPPAGGAEAAVPGLVGLPVEHCAVVAVAVDFDQQPGLWVGEIDPSDPADSVTDVELQPCGASARTSK
jgi:hypothetical protein